MTDERCRHNRAAVAIRADELVGIAMSDPPGHVTAAWTMQPHVCSMCTAPTAARALDEHCWRPSFAERSRRYFGSLTQTLVRARSTANTASFPTGQPQVEHGMRGIHMIRDVQHTGEPTGEMPRI